MFCSARNCWLAFFVAQVTISRLIWMKMHWELGLSRPLRSTIRSIDSRYVRQRKSRHDVRIPSFHNDARNFFFPLLSPNSNCKLAGWWLAKSFFYMCVVIFSTYIFQLSIAFEYSPRRHGLEREWAILMSDYRQFRTPPSLTAEYVVLLFSLVMTDEKKKSQPRVEKHFSHNYQRTNRSSSFGFASSSPPSN